MTITSDKYSAEMIQQARDIVAYAFVVAETTKGIRPVQYKTFAAWGAHIDSYSQYMRDGVYDDDLAIQSTLVALALVQS